MSTNRLPPRRHALHRWGAAAAWLGCVATAGHAPAQAAPRELRSKPPGEKIERRTLTTKDGVELGVTYYRSTAGRDATPVVMLHDLKETRAVFHNFAQRLQTPPREATHPSFAVVTVDLRGHGDSMLQRYRGGTRTIDNAKLDRGDYEAMVLADMEAVRKLLVTENDANRLNLNRLAVVGVGLGASVAVNWTARDWSMPPLATGKQGQDVKALALVSPRWKSGGLSMQQAVRVPGLQRRVAVLMMYGGGDRRVRGDAARLFNQLERGRPGPLQVAPGEQPPDELPSLVSFGPDSKLQGADWLKQAGRNAEDLIIRFVTQHAVTPDYPHLRRRTL